MEPVQAGLGVLSGVLVGFTLGLVGGGGSILAVPLMVYLVGLRDAHVAIGTSAAAVAANALAGLASHARARTVRWRCATVFAAAGVMGALLGAHEGKIMGGQRLLLAFAVLMVGVGALMLRARAGAGDPMATCTRDNAGRIAGTGLATGLLSGFFGIGGGFLIVPGLMASTGMPILNAVGTSLVAVACFGFSTSVSYALSGMVDWPLAGLFVAGGVAGSLGGTRAARHLAASRGLLTRIFACIIFVVAAYMVWRGIAAPA
ncbi:sulfite exporter TauE/SafE family protein [Nguyenibacter sp. L1]|uniref:sulfite exporter TauE/SafE family protein n=1 Tax=Nguyenibacter sp. L1 TaxID=3049350 RepID=UPI002B4723A5|nr:sulfite exporter TauE/SafE family protein [Nguyenibacter sp. L1]WRH89388.1 sulfite exporter TauE/SafE family protein [Nguyenibacter sp. L1]